MSRAFRELDNAASLEDRAARLEALRSWRDRWVVQAYQTVHTDVSLENLKPSLPKEEARHWLKARALESLGRMVTEKCAEELPPERREFDDMRTWRLTAILPDGET